MAARTADLPLMKLLVRHGADFRLPNQQGRTPLLAAAGVALGPEADEAATEAEAMLAVTYLLAPVSVEGMVAWADWTPRTVRAARLKLVSATHAL